MYISVPLRGLKPAIDLTSNGQQSNNLKRASLHSGDLSTVVPSPELRRNYARNMSGFGHLPGAAGGRGDDDGVVVRVGFVLEEQGWLAGVLAVD